MIYVPAAVMRTPFADWDETQRAPVRRALRGRRAARAGAGIPDVVCGWLLQIRERFDGSGPERLAGDAIPVVARLARAACAATPCSPRRRGATASRSAAPTRSRRLRAAAGRELDPEVVEALAAVLEPD